MADGKTSRRTDMSQTSGSNNTAIVAIVVVAFVSVAGFLAYQNGMFGEKGKSGVNIELDIGK
jgi:hypothetical protein